MLIHRITQDRDLARTSKDTLKKDLLSTLIGECTKKNKVPSDDECEAVIRKFIKGADEIIDLMCKTGNPEEEHSIKAWQEKLILTPYLPAKLTEPELRTVLTGIIADNKCTSLGEVMGILKKSWDGKYDGRVASVLVKELLGGV